MAMPSHCFQKVKKTPAQVAKSVGAEKMVTVLDSWAVGDPDPFAPRQPPLSTTPNSRNPSRMPSTGRLPIIGQGTIPPMTSKASIGITDFVSKRFLGAEASKARFPSPVQTIRSFGTEGPGPAGFYTPPSQFGRGADDEEEEVAVINKKREKQGQELQQQQRQRQQEPEPEEMAYDDEGLRITKAIPLLLPGIKREGVNVSETGL